VTEEQKGLSEQAINKAAEIGLSSQLDEVENLDVDLKTDPLALVHGKVESAAVVGEGMVMQGDLRVEEMQIEIDEVSLNPIQAALGKIELTKPTQGSAKIVLSEADINRAFNSDYIREKLQKKSLDVNGEEITVVPQQVDFRLPGEGKITLKATVLVRQTSKIEKIAFSAVPKISAGGQSVVLENVEYDEGEKISPELTRALVDETGDILNLNNFNLKGMSFKIEQLAIEANKLILQAEAYIENIPAAR
jgi:hypothetical protein